MSVHFSGQATLLDKRIQGESHSSLSFFTRSEGLVRVKVRTTARGRVISQPDLFNVVEITLSASAPGRPFYLKDFLDIKRFPKLAEHYSRLKAASSLATLIRLNLSHLEEFETTWDIYTRSIEAIANKPMPSIAYLKAAFLFSRSEGYSVNRGWLNTLASPQKAQAIEILASPIEEIPEELDASVSSIIRSFHDFLKRETEIIPPVD